MTAPRYVERIPVIEARQWTPNVPESIGPMWLWLELRGLNPTIADGFGGRTAMVIGDPDDNGDRLRVEPSAWVLLDLHNRQVFTLPPTTFHHRYTLAEEYQL